MTLAKGFLVVLLLMLVSPVQAEIVSGIVDISGGGFDFSEQSYTADLSEGDLWLADVDPPGCSAVYSCSNGSVVTGIEDTTLGAVEVAPDDSNLYGCGECARGDVVYVIHTADGLYAKFAFIDWPEGDYFPNSWTIQYYLQTDGSRNLGGVPVDGATWGRIKALYRANTKASR